MVLLAATNAVRACSCGTPIVVESPTAESTVATVEPTVVTVPANEPANSVSRVEKPVVSEQRSTLKKPAVSQAGMPEARLFRTAVPELNYRALPEPKPMVRESTRVPDYDDIALVSASEEKATSVEAQDDLPETFPPDPFEAEIITVQKPETTEPATDISAKTESKPQVRGQVGADAKILLEGKPSPPEGPVDSGSLPENLTQDEKPAEEERPSAPQSEPEPRPHSYPDQGTMPIPPGAAGTYPGTGQQPPYQPQQSGQGNWNPGMQQGGGLATTEPKIDQSSMTMTALIILAAVSTGGFLYMVFIVEDYRKRWLNSITSQNGRISSGAEGLLDLPPMSSHFGRYHGDI